MSGLKGKCCSKENGWINSDLFLELGQMFTEQLPRDNPRPHVLLLDRHSSHVYNLDFIQLVKAISVGVMAYPSHTRLALQLADKALFKSLKHNWDEDGWKWTRRMAGQKLPKTECFSLFHRAWQKTGVTVENAQAGFRGTGMLTRTISLMMCTHQASRQRGLCYLQQLRMNNPQFPGLL